MCVLSESQVLSKKRWMISNQTIASQQINRNKQNNSITLKCKMEMQEMNFINWLY